MESLMDKIKRWPYVSLSVCVCVLIGNDNEHVTLCSMFAECGSTEWLRDTSVEWL